MPASSVPSPVIVADIGGTNARFAIAPGPGMPVERIKSFKDTGFGVFADALAAYLGEIGEPRPHAVAIGAAGPLLHGTIHLTNLAWTIDPASIHERFGLRIALLANDLVAMASGIALAPPEAFLPLPGPLAEAPRRTLVIAVGTGLGVAWYEREAGRAVIHSTEAGHMRFAPTSDPGIRLLAALLDQRGAVSFENIVSGSGIRLVYASLRGTSDAELGKSEQVLLAAEGNASQAARATLDLVMVALATFARDLVLVLGGVDEIVFAGGLGRRLRSAMAAQSFLQALRDSHGLPLDFSRLALRVALDDTLPLKGAAHLAFGLADCAQAYREGNA